MSIKDDEKFQLLYTNCLRQYHQLMYRKHDFHSHFKASRDHSKLTNILIAHIDKYIEEQRKEAIEEFKQSDEYSSWRIY